MSPLRLLYQQYPAILGLFRSGQVFDSHDFIQRLSQAKQVTYIQALSRYTNRRDPFRKLHAVLSRLRHYQRGLIQHGGFHYSADIFGDVVDCGAWVKL